MSSSPTSSARRMNRRSTHRRCAIAITVVVIAYLICAATTRLTPTTYATHVADDNNSSSSTIATLTPADTGLQLCAPLIPRPAGDPGTARNRTAYPCLCSSDAHNFSLRINCQSAGLNDTHFRQPLQLEPFAVELQLAGNLLADVPALQSATLRRLDLSHNLIQRLYGSAFASVGASLVDLILSWNQIDRISIDAFAGLAALRTLDMTKNHLGQLANNVFSPMPRLGWLDVSRNRDLNESFARPGFSVYMTWGVSTELRTLRAEECGISALQLEDGGVHLEELWVKYNRLQAVPLVPRGLRVLDVSGNPVRELQAKSVGHLGELEELYLQDMPNLTEVGAWSLDALPKLRKLLLTGSYKLRRFDAWAFGRATATGGNQTVSSLSELDLSGTQLTGLNVTVEGTRLRELVAAVSTIDLMGAPVQCGCDLEWLLLHRNRTAGAQLVGECAGPAELRERKLAELRVEDLDCRAWPDWVYRMGNGLAILVMLALCVTATWCLVTHIRPRSRRQRLQKVGDTSPYARVTIEPNRAEM